MSEESDLEKTEDASDSHLQKARESGDVPRSRELATCASLLAAAMGFYAFGPSASGSLTAMMRNTLEFDSAIAFDAQLLAQKLGATVIDLFIAFAPFGLLTLAVAIAAPVLIGGWSMSFEAIAPNFGRMNPMSGLKNMISVRSLIELIKAILKTLFVGVLAYFAIKASIPVIQGLLGLPAEAAMSETLYVLVKCFLIVSSGMVVIAAIDVPYQLIAYANKMKMTKEQVRQESKEANGNPQLKAKIRRQQREMASRRMMAAVPEADVVIVNPTHYAVAIKYAEDSMRAPTVLAKGVDDTAMKIREIASAYKVLTVESPKLARALYANTEIEDEIPEALYTAVAEILAYVFQIRHFMANRHAVYPNMPQQVPVPDELDPQHRAYTNRGRQ